MAATGLAARLLVYTGDPDGKHYAFNLDVENSQYLQNPEKDEVSGQIKLHLCVLTPTSNPTGTLSVFTDAWRDLDIHEKAVWGFSVDDSFPGQTNRDKETADAGTQN
jgi:hypothetical protein